MKLINQYLNKSFSVGGEQKNRFALALSVASRSTTYVETVDSTVSDTLHWRIKQHYAEELQCCFEEVIRCALKKLRIRNVVLAIDGTEDLYWGKHGGLDVRQRKFDHGTDEAYVWVVISIVQPIALPLMALPYRQGDDLAELSLRLLAYAKGLKLSIHHVLFDRGFYSGHLIAGLESRGIRYLMLVPEQSPMKSYAEQTKTIKGFQHRITYARDMSTWHATTKIVVVKTTSKKGKPMNLYFATNLRTSRRLVKKYMKRWQIETNFRVMEEARIKTKSSIQIIRYFYFLLQLLLQVAWTLTKKLVHPVSFKRYLIRLAMQLQILAHPG